MSTEKDSMLRVRLTKRQSDELDAIIGELQAQMPEASVTTSSIARYALEKYVSDHIAKRDGTKILIEINTADATEEDIKNLYDLLPSCLTNKRELLTNGSLHGWRDIRAVMMKMASLMKPKKPGVKAGE